MKLSDILDLDQLHKDIIDGYVNVRHHDADPSLAIFNYSHKAQTDKHWNDVTRVTRGLIVRRDNRLGFDGEIVARPFSKFFNLGEHPEGKFSLDERVFAVDKMDGSLGILYPHPNGGYAIATRGSFHSEQAVKGTEILQRAIEHGFEPRVGYTYCFEIIYPENRIVLDYRDKEELILLFSRDTAAIKSPSDISAERYFDVPAYRHGTLAEILEDLHRENKEGWVVHFTDRYGPLWETSVKVKQEDYLALHRVVTNLNELTVWEYAKGDIYEWGKFRNQLPEELQAWFDGETYKLDELKADIESDVWRFYYDTIDAAATPLTWGVPIDHEARKRFAQAVQGHELAPLAFLILDDKLQQLDEAIWKMVRPTMTNNRAEKEAA